MTGKPTGDELEALEKLEAKFLEAHYQERLQPVEKAFFKFVYQMPVIPQECLNDSKLYTDRQALIQSLPKRMSIAEIGVASGEFSEILIKELKPVYFGAIDTFTGKPETFGMGQINLQNLFKGKSHYEFYKEKIAEIGKLQHFEMEIRKGNSWDEILNLNRKIDLFYIDASHGFSEIIRDVRACLRKHSEDAFLVFNDYCWTDVLGGWIYGVIPVVNCLCSTGRWKVHSFALEAGMFCDICLQHVT